MGSNHYFHRGDYKANGEESAIGQSEWKVVRLKSQGNDREGKLGLLSPLDAGAHGMEACVILSASLTKIS